MSLGIDVSKLTLSCALQGKVKEFANTTAGHVALLNWAGGARVWCMEATGRYHQKLADLAYESGHRVLVVNPSVAKKYLGFVSYRGKTDPIDALALARLAEREGEDLTPYKPIPESVIQARDILVRRRALVEARVSLTQVAESAGDPQGHLKGTIEQITLTQKEIERQLVKVLKGYAGYHHLLGIPGIGPLSAAILVCTLERGEFVTSDSLVAFAGLDPRARESGQYRGKRKLSHHGDAQLRTILFMAARTGARLDYWKPYYQNQRAKGFSTTEATVILTRKMLRVAWSVYKQNSHFIPKLPIALDKPT